MLSWVLFYILAAVCSARRTQPFPLYSGASLVPQAELIQKLVAAQEGEQGDFEDHRQVKDTFPFQLQQDSTSDAWNKDSSQQEKITNMVDDLKAAVLKLATVDSLRSRGFQRSEQNLPKANKRACFWKYCVTN